MKAFALMVVGLYAIAFLTFVVCVAAFVVLVALIVKGVSAWSHANRTPTSTY
jgi:hypothetical protein